MINRQALEAAGVYANDDVERINAESTVRIEMPLAIRRASVGFYGSATIGAFGTFDSVVGPDVASIVRYVSVACGAQLGVFEHPIDMLTNSAVTFHAGYFGEGPEPAPIATKPPIVIEHDVLVGDGALIKRGVTLHTGCIVGARVQRDKGRSALRYRRRKSRPHPQISPAEEDHPPAAGVAMVDLRPSPGPVSAGRHRSRACLSRGRQARALHRPDPEWLGDQQNCRDP